MAHRTAAWSGLLLLLAAAVGNQQRGPKSLVVEDFFIKDQHGKIVANIAAGLADGLRRSAYKDCKVSSDDVTECRRWDDGTQMSIRIMNYCVSTTVKESKLDITSCMPLGDSHWYGGGEERNQKWPLEKYQDLQLPLVPSSENNRAIQDPLWLSSDGRLLYVGAGSPAFVLLNTTEYRDQLCVQYKLSSPYRQRLTGYTLKQTMCKFDDVKEAFQYAMENLVAKPTGYPDERMIRYPVWSTWAKYKTNINESVVKQFAKEIKEHGFQNSQLEIDDAWETCYGSKEVDKSRFPNMRKLTDDLKKDGFRVTIWTHPFIQLDCTETLKEAAENGYLVKNMEGSTSTHWWNGNASIIDFTKGKAAEWFVEKHKRMMIENGVDGFKFDAGEVSWNPQLPDFNIPASPTEAYPNLATQTYVETCARFNRLTEIRSAFWTQKLPIFLRMIDKDSHWGENNGLKSLVTTLLQMNMVGYSMVLPDMIGGNQYNGEVATQELFIRWLQANTFMPALQYALVPWDYKEKQVNTVMVAKKFNDLHAAYADIIIKAMQKKVKDGSPVNAPIWWIDPKDENALKEDSEYLLGENLLAAPVLEQGSTKRDVYLPKGVWRDGNDRAKTYVGPTLLKDYHAPLDTLPWFVIVGSDADIETNHSGSSTLATHSMFTLLILFGGTFCAIIV